MVKLKWYHYVKAYFQVIHLLLWHNFNLGKIRGILDSDKRKIQKRIDEIDEKLRKLDELLGKE